jgi:protein SCO1/2
VGASSRRTLRTPRLIALKNTAAAPDAAQGRRRGCDTRLVRPLSATTETSAPRSGSGLKLALPAVVIFVVLAGVTLLLVGGSSRQALPGNAAASKTARFDGATLSPILPAPPLSTLRNYDGTSFNLAAQRGKAVFVTFLYANCPDVCPLIAANLHNAYSTMTPALRRRVAIVAVSVDPHGDTAGTVRAFVERHELTGEASYLIGPATQLVPVWKTWNVGSQQDVSRPDLVNHSALVYGVSASGQLTTIYPANFTPREVVHDASVLLAS